MLKFSRFARNAKIERRYVVQTHCFSTVGWMNSLHDFQILPQPNEITCGPTCLHAVYRFFDDERPLQEVISETPQLEDGGTLAVLMGRQALQRGYRVKIYTYNLRIFDPSWFELRSEQPTNGSAERPPPLERVPKVNLIEKLEEQRRVKIGVRMSSAMAAYLSFLRAGGEICMHDLSKPLIRHYLERQIPILTGLSATYLYQSSRERQRDMRPDDIRGTPTGHFVVICGEDRRVKKARVADPYLPNPFAKDHYYEVNFDRLICAILLGVLTYDANLTIIQPGD